MKVYVGFEKVKGVYIVYSERFTVDSRFTDSYRGVLSTVTLVYRVTKGDL